VVGQQSQALIDHFYFNIQGWFNYHDIYDRAVVWFPSGSHFVELGSWKGRSSCYLATLIHNSGKKIRLDCVDTWKGSWEHNLSDEEIDDNDGIDAFLSYQLKNLKKKNLYEQFKKNIKPVEHIIRAIQGESTEVAKSYKDHSIDFIMIDGSHDADSVYEDLKAWEPKLKSSGILSGDDIREKGVKEGLDRYATELGHFEYVLSANAFPSWVRINAKTKKFWNTPLL